MERRHASIPPALLVLLLLGPASPAVGQAAPSRRHLEARLSAAAPVTAPAWGARLSTVRPPTAAWEAEALPSDVVRQSGSSRKAILVGAVMGAALGGAVFLLTADGCWRRGDSMCGLSVPLYVGSGAAVGGVIGYVVGRRGRERN